MEERKPHGYWKIRENVENAAALCSNKSELAYKFCRAYAMAKKYGYLNELFPEDKKNSPEYYKNPFIKKNEDVFKKNKTGKLNRWNIHTFYGNKYGKLTLIKKSDKIEVNKKGHNILLADFKCDCGNIITKKASMVMTKGHKAVKSCGCLVKEVGIIRGQKMRVKSVSIGDVFGYVTVVKEIEGSHPRQILTKCVCGNDKTFGLLYLTSGFAHKASCGCKFNLTQIERGKKNIRNVVKVGDVYNCLTVTKIDLIKTYLGKNETKLRACETQCVCGKITIMPINTLINGKISCGCQNGIIATKRFTKHNLHKTSEYQIFSNIKQRCINPKNNNYSTYGALGVKVCERWLKPAPEGFTNFMEDMGPRPSPKYSIDRINPEGDYEPSNCRWATSKEQGQNKRIKTCPHCGIVIKGPNYKRYHGDNCKHKSPDKIKNLPD